jgi:hypothetical protein
MERFDTAQLPLEEKDLASLTHHKTGLYLHCPTLEKY